MNALRSARAPFVLALLVTLVGMFSTVEVARADSTFDYFPITPCRVYNNSGAQAGTNYPVTIVGAACPDTIPAEAKAISLNVTVAQATAQGVLYIIPEVPDPSLAGDVLNFGYKAPISYPPPRPDRTLVTRLFKVALRGDGTIVFQATGSATFRLVVDVIGYYRQGAPLDLSLDNSSVQENVASGTMIGTFSTADPGEVGSHTYSFTTGEGATDNGSFQIDGDMLKTGAGPFDMETKSSYTVRVKSTDSEGFSIEDDFLIDITNVNEAPVLVPGGALNYSESDPATAINSNLAITDDSTNLQSATVQITGNYQNGQDVLSFVDTATITAGAFDTATGTLTLTGTDTVANWQTALRNVLYNNTSNDPSALTRTVTWIATDDGSLSSTGVTSTINLSSTNSQPTITAIDDQTIDEDTSTSALAFTVGDAETAVGSLTVTGSSSNVALIPNANIVFGGSGANRTVTVTPAANANGGPVTITITVNDGSGQPNSTNTETFDVTITATNDQPTVTAIADQTIDEDTSTSALAFTVGDQETAVGSLTVTASSSNQAIIPDANIVLGGTNPNRTVTVTPAANANGGPVTITITVNDGSGAPNATATETFDVTVNAVNDQPTISDVADQVVNEDTPTSALPVTVGDLETAVGSLTLSGTSSDQSIVPNANIVFGGSGASRTVTVTPAVNANGGPVTITITVNDGSGAPNATASDTFNLTVNSVNDNPTVTAIADQVIDEDTSTGALAFTIADADTAVGSLTVTATSSDQTLIPNANVVLGGSGASRTVTVTPAANQFGGPVTITITVDDGGGSPGIETFTVTVTSINDQPTITGIANQTIDEDTATAALAFTIGDIETAAGTLTVSGTSSNGTLIPNGNIVIGGSGANRTVTVTPAANQFGGPVTITVTVNDGSGAGNATNSTTFTVTINSVNDQPTITGIANQTIDEDTSTGALAFTIGDVETAAGTLTVGGSSLDTTLIPNGNIVFGGAGANRTVTITPALNQFGGPVTITITVNDGSGQPNATNTSVFTVTVNPVNDPPMAGTDNFETFGNTELRINLDDNGVTTPHVAIDLGGNPGVRNNDSDPVEGTVVTVTGVVGCTDLSGPTFGDDQVCSTANGGQVILGADGSFRYTPPQANPAQPLSVTSDSFQYTITDTDPAPATATGTVNLTLREVFWYIDPTAAAGGDGRSHRPFQNFASLNGVGGAGDLDNADDYILVHDGTFNGSVELEAGQRLLGQGVAFSHPLGSLGTFVILPQTTQPQITNASGDVIKVTAAVPARIAGLSLQGSVNAIDMQATGAYSGPGTMTIESNTFRGAGAEGIDVNAGATGTLALNIQNNSWSPAGTHTGNAVDVAATNGALQLNLSGNTGVLSTGASAIVAGASAPGTLTVTGLANNTVHQNTAGTGISINTALFDATPGGAVNRVYGGATLIGTPGDGVGGAGLALTNVTGDLAFGDALTPGDLDVYSAGAALSATSTVVGGIPQFRLTVMPTDNAGTSTLAATGGAAVDIDAVTADLRLSGLSSSGGLKGVSLVRLLPGSPAATFPAIFRAPSGSSSINTSNAAATAFRVDQSNAAVTYQGAITTTAGRGVDLTSNTGSTIAFSGTLSLTSGSNPAFTATGGGTVTATDTASTLASTSGTALNVANTTIGAGGLRFLSISANGATNGIVLSNTGSTAGLTVSGNGTTDGSGGTIQNTSGDGVVLTSTRFANLKNLVIGDAAATAGQTPNATNNIGGNGIAMNGADDVTLDNVKIARTATHGIDGTGVTNLTISNSEIFNAGDSNEDSALDFSDLNQNNLDGTVQITNTVIDGFTEDGVFIENFSGTLAMTVSGSTFSNSANTLCGGSTCGENGIQIRSDGTANYTLTVNGSTQFNAVDGNGILAVAEGTAATPSVVNVSNTTFTNATALGIVLFGGTGDATSTIQSLLNFTIGPSVSLTGTKSTGISIQPNGKSTMRGSVTATVNGSQIGRGIEVLSDDASTAVVSILNSVVSNTAFNGIFVSNQNVGKLDIHVRGNTVSAPLDTIPASGLAVHGTEINVRETSVNCLDIASNQSVGNAASGGAGYRTRQRDTSTFRLERFSGNGASTTDVQNFLVAQNTSGTASSTVATSYTGVADGFCEDP